jgi:hypothetical protein
MDYLKIAEIAHRCEVKRQQMSEHYRMIGANRTFNKETQDIILAAIKDMKSDLARMEDKLRKYLTSPS